MHRNIEIKAKLRDVERTISRATELNDVTHNRTKIEQHDTFFKIENGRLKLRKFEDSSAELIWYNRFDVPGPKLSTYKKITLSSDIAESIGDIFSQCFGVLGVVKKTRLLYMVGQTRVHIDKVDGLGDFIELEVMLQEDQDVEAGQKIANDLMPALFIKEDDLISEAYIDLLNSTMKKNDCYLFEDAKA